MSRKRHTPEQIIHKLRQAEVELSKGATVPQAARKIGVTEQTYYRWRSEYGGMRVDQAKRLKALETENARLKKLVADQESEPWYAWAETLEQMAGCARRRKQLHILSPFDNLVIDRRRLRALFDFDFSLECYLPAPRRRYGYFCLPILWGDRFIGRLDPKADRRRHTLVVRRLIFESTPVSYGQLLPPLARRLRAFAAFNDCPEVLIEEARPRKVLAPLRSEIRSASRE